MFTIHVIDNGLIKLSGHHYHHALGMISGVKELGLKLQIYCMDDPKLPNEIKAIAKPVLKKFLYRPDPHQNIDSYATYLAQEIQELTPNFGGHDILLFPNANYDEIAAISKYIYATNYRGRIILRLMFYPHGDTVAYLRLLHEVLKYPNVDVVVSSLPYSQWLIDNQITNRYIPGLPHNLPYDLVEKIPEVYDFAYLGQPAAVKGFEHLINALLLLAQNNIRPKALIHAQGVKLSEQIKNNLSHCTFVDGEISDQQFYSDLIASKCIVTFYSVDNYRYSDSGIVTESIALNKCLISSLLPFIGPTFGEVFAREVSVVEWTALALAHKMAEVYLAKDKSSMQNIASLKAKILCSPTVFVSNLLDR
jgi:glycosyltransferase involved in cell wall biosynthesis